MYITSMDQIILLSVITADISFTLTETKLFLPFRTWMSKGGKSLEKLVNCGYCTGHWIAFILMGLYKPRLFNSYAFLDYFLTALAIAWIAAFQWIVLCWLMDKVGK